MCMRVFHLVCFSEAKGHNLYQLFKTYHVLVFSLSDILDS